MWWSLSSLFLALISSRHWTEDHTSNTHVPHHGWYRVRVRRTSIIIMRDSLQSLKPSNADGWRISSEYLGNSPPRTIPSIWKVVTRKKSKTSTEKSWRWSDSRGTQSRMPITNNLCTLLFLNNNSINELMQKRLLSKSGSMSNVSSSIVISPRVISHISSSSIVHSRVAIWVSPRRRRQACNMSSSSIASSRVSSGVTVRAFSSKLLLRAVYWTFVLLSRRRCRRPCSQSVDLRKWILLRLI